MEQSSCYFPLRWESTGDQWWYASPIDWAAADGHYDIVRQLLHLDPNLLIKLTSLRRIRRLEALWDDDARFADAARHRASVARSLLLECECRNHRPAGGGENTLLRAGYGGWVLYTAASAGDVAFVQELLDRDPLLVFGEGEYGVTDMFYAAARGGSADAFRLLLDHAMSPRCSTNCRDGEGGAGRGSVFRLEMMSRAVHAAARGGSVEMLRELLQEGRSGVSVYLDVRGSTVLHAAAGRGQLQVVKYLLTSFDIINSTDNHGNTALHVAAYRGHQPVVEALVAASPSTLSAVNHAGDTFLHSAVAGFRTPGFRRLDRQMELMRYLISERKTDMQKIINLKNDAGLTALHLAMVGCAHPDLVELLMTTPSIDLNAEDANGMTALALLKQQLRSATSDRLIKQIVSAGGVLNSSILRTRSAIASQIKMQGGIASSPGTTFKVSDAEIFLFSGIGAAESQRPSSCSSNGKDDPAQADANGAENHGSTEKRLSSASRAKDRLKMMLKWPRNKEKMSKALKKSEDSSPLDSIKKLGEHGVETPTPLRQKFTKTTALNGKRTLAVKSSTPGSSATKKKLNTKLIHGIMEAMPQLAPPPARSRSPSDTFPRSSMSSTPTPLAKLKDICLDDDEIAMVTPPVGRLKDIVLDSDDTTEDPSCSNSSMDDGCGGTAESAARKQHGCGNGRLINICFGAQGLTVEDTVSGQPTSKMFKQQCLRVS
ncbi:ankyrin repeat and death domain-containing protein 1A [Panicum miliaceum]|uniref:Ankyrin repeat and death domain-containing protein 1A n=1 Tax=Panicum miliaceum TaxID=4540 RepID=A0A3L6QJM3_PANMI|nr:ankyrin repeat and death domain-containing protein 1A [Panicum miliaceum]